MLSYVFKRKQLWLSKTLISEMFCETYLFHFYASRNRPSMSSLEVTILKSSLTPCVWELSRTLGYMSIFDTCERCSTPTLFSCRQVYHVIRLLYFTMKWYVFRIYMLRSAPRIHSLNIPVGYFGSVASFSEHKPAICCDI